MKLKTIIPITSAILAVSAGATQAAVVSLEILGYATGSGQIANTSTDVPGGGTAANFTTYTSGDSIIFNMGDANTATNDVVAQLRVSLTSLSTNNTQVMLAQTTNSQGLTDTGTLSLLIGNNNGGSGGIHDATIQFEWLTADGSAALDNEYTIRSFDVDFNQFNSMATADVASVTAGSDLTVDTVGTDTRAFDGANTNSNFDNPTNAVTFATVEGNTQSINVGKTPASQGNQLYMFEFRADSEVIPEPSSTLLILVGATALGLRRRRS